MANTVSDYTGFDFDSLWRGREKVTQVEISVLHRYLRPATNARVLEIGAGSGRLTPTLASRTGELVLSDFARDLLTKIGRSDPVALSDRAPRVAANLYHLPFRSGAFTGATLIRVFHHLDDPVAALTEVRRVLTGSGTLLLSYNPRPSFGTLANDLRSALGRSASAKFRSVTFARRGTVALSPDPFPIYVGSRATLRANVLAAGFSLDREMVSGLEEIPIVRHLPKRLFESAAEVFGNAPGFPTRWAILRNPESGLGPLPSLRQILACPVCRGPLDWPCASGPIRCPNCGYAGEVGEGVIDLRYVEDRARRFSLSG